MNTTPTPPRSVTIRTRPVGQCFGVIGQLVARGGRVLAETQVCPYGYEAAAEAAARTLAADRGWTVR